MHWRRDRESFSILNQQVSNSAPATSAGKWRPLPQLLTAPFQKPCLHQLLNLDFRRSSDGDNATNGLAASSNGDDRPRLYIFHICANSGFQLTYPNCDRSHTTSLCDHII